MVLTITSVSESSGDFMRKAITVLMLLMSVTVFGQETLNVRYAGVMSKWDGSIIAAQCGQRGLAENECQFILISKNNFGEDVYSEIIPGKTFPLNRLVHLMNNNFDYHMKRPKNKWNKDEWYRGTKAVWEFFERPLNEGDGGPVVLIVAPVWIASSLAVGIAESVFYGFRAPVIAVVSQIRLKKLKKGEQVVKVKRDHFLRILENVKSFEHL